MQEGGQKKRFYLVLLQSNAKMFGPLISDTIVDETYSSECLYEITSELQIEKNHRIVLYWIGEHQPDVVPLGHQVDDELDQA